MKGIYEVKHTDREKILGKLERETSKFAGICPGPTSCPISGDEDSVGTSNARSNQQKKRKQRV